jgi:biotin carboxyl carrier protein
VKKFLILFFMGFFVGNTFAEPQNNPKSEIPNRADDNKKIVTKLINIKAPDTADPGSKWTTEILVHRGAWVESDTVVAVLNDGEKDVYVKSPDTGVVTKILVAQGDSVSKGAALIQLKKVDIQRSNFRLAWNIFSLMNVNVNSVGKRIGGKVQENIDIPEKEQGKWTNACAVRMSLILNNTGFPIKQGKYPTVSGKMGGFYIYRLNDLISYLKDIFGEPDIVVNRIPTPDDFSLMKGILIVTGNGGGDASGHATLWNGSTCPDACRLAGDERNETFKPTKAVLWVLP